MSFLSCNNLPFETVQTHEVFMHRALELAQVAGSLQEVPVGAVALFEGEVVGEGFNQPVGSNNPCAHAEILALMAAGERLGNYRLPSVTLYATLEPCTMCWGAMVHARIQTLVYGASEPKTGAFQPSLALHQHSGYNHQVEIVQGVMEEACSSLLSDFFKTRRAKSD